MTAHVRERWSRRRLLHLLLVATLVVSPLTVVLSVAESIGSEGGVEAWRLAADLLFLVLLMALLAANRRGHTMMASWVFCGTLVVNASEFFRLPELDRALVIYAVPIIVAAFLIKPVAAFELLALCVADYLVAYLRHAREVPFNWFSLVVLLGVAWATWLAARRATWFEEADEIHRSELDLAIAEREALEAQVAALRGELDAERSAGARAGDVVWGPTMRGASTSASDAWRLSRDKSPAEED